MSHGPASLCEWRCARVLLPRGFRGTRRRVVALAHADRQTPDYTHSHAGYRPRASSPLCDSSPLISSRCCPLNGYPSSLPRCTLCFAAMTDDRHRKYRNTQSVTTTSLTGCGNRSVSRHLSVPLAHPRFAARASRPAGLASSASIRFYVLLDRRYFSS